MMILRRVLRHQSRAVARRSTRVRACFKTASCDSDRTSSRRRTTVSEAAEVLGLYDRGGALLHLLADAKEEARMPMPPFVHDLILIELVVLVTALVIAGVVAYWEWRHGRW